MTRRVCLLALVVPAAASFAQTPENVLVVVNQSSEISRRIVDYYTRKRAIPAANVCRLHVTEAEEIDWVVYEKQIEEPVAACLKQGRMEDRILYIVTTLGVPLRVRGAGEGMATEISAVDSELTLLYAKMRGSKFSRAGLVANPFDLEPLLEAFADSLNHVGNKTPRQAVESAVLALVGGKAILSHPERCVGHAKCIEVCPTSALSLAFGNTLHVTGEDEAALEQTVHELTDPALRWRKADAGLEDVFIHLMESVQDDAE